ncbi:protein TonB [Aquabacterium commune]|uniref:Protein TonB n=1 Tax=Aquabacterium commune TaxID=70586 RepID=A0A4R6R568_9BURK|nr:energy transducer TonB [Aquabacterium commune]TDP81013.1 protein TonB [Aquabacterium commune]
MPPRLIALWKSLSLLQVCLGVSALLHIGLFSFRLVDPEGFQRTFENTPLEVILVNAGSEAKPDQAQALAQQNLAGGGEASTNVRATSPLPPSPDNEVGDALAQTARMIEQMQAEQQQLLTQVRQELAALPPPQPRAPTDAQQAQAEEERRRQLTKLLAELEKRIFEENARPKKRYLSPATLKSADALYYSAFRTRVERAGTEHFPSANGQKLYGELVMEVWVNRQGKIVEAIVTRSSGNKALDKRARGIVMAMGQFDPVPPEVSAGHDLLLISSRFRFTRDAGLEATTVQSATPATPAPQTPEPPPAP